MSKYYLIAGENSGDIHGANLVGEIAKQDSSAVFRGLGGDHMQENGVHISQHFKDIAFMGFKEVALHLGTISKAIRECKKDLLKFNPDVVVLIDYPGFNLRMAQYAKNLNIKVIYYISPQIWAWKAKRIKKIRKYVDKMISILPFEKDFYSTYNFPVDYVGHPLLDQVRAFVPDTDFRLKYNPQKKKLIAVLPGSRQQEISKLLPLILSVCKKYPDYTFLIAAISSVDPQLYNSVKLIPNAALVMDDSYNILYHSDAGIIKSGTSTIEAALFELPFVVVYRTTGITYRLSKALIKVPFIALVNLVMGKEIVKELIQNNFNLESLSGELEDLISIEEYKVKMKADFRSLKEKLGNTGASKRAAEIIRAYLNN